MSKHLGKIVVLLVCLPGACGAWYYRLNFRALNENDYTTVSGTLKSAEQLGTYKSMYLEFYIRESPIRFRVPTDSYRNSFDGQSFASNVRPGSKIEFKVEKAQLANPAHPPGDGKDTVYVYALRDNTKEYSTLAGYEKWRRTNVGYALVMAIVFTIATLGSLAMLFVSAGAKAPAISAGESLVMREKHLKRVYRHAACGGETCVSGDDYVLLECPFRPVQKTYCAACNSFVPLTTVSWVDSGENIAAYRQQLFESVPFKRRLWLQVFGNAYEGAINLGLDKNGLPVGM
jgi:hypothetical protein